MFELVINLRPTFFGVGEALSCRRQIAQPIMTACQARRRALVVRSTVPDVPGTAVRQNDGCCAEAEGRTQREAE
jgi:hypothetical protein